MIQIPGFSLSHSFQKVTGTLRHFRAIWIRVKKRRHQTYERTCHLRRIFRSPCLKNCWCKSTFNCVSILPTAQPAGLPPLLS